MGVAGAPLVGFIDPFFSKLLYQFIVILLTNITAGCRKNPAEGEGGMPMEMKRHWRTIWLDALWQSSVSLLWSFGVSEMLGALSARLHELGRYRSIHCKHIRHLKGGQSSSAAPCPKRDGF